MVNDLGRSHFLTFLPDAVKVSMKVQLGLDISLSWMSSSEAVKPDDVVSTLRFESSDSEGVLAIFFSKSSLQLLTSKMLGSSSVESKEDTLDAACEILNIIYAFARKNVNAMDFDFQPAIPVIKPDPISVLHSVSAPQISTLICQFPKGSFHIELSLRKKQ